MPVTSQYVRVTEDNPCPVCGRVSWCLIHHSGRKVICPRVKSANRAGAAGWVHYIGSGRIRKPDVLRNRKPTVYLPIRQVRKYLRRCRPDGRMLVIHATRLRLSPRSLAAMRAGYDPESAALTFPMFDESYRPIGCRLRRTDGRKWSLRGGREGVFLPRKFEPTEPVFITEGPTDAAAMIEAGFHNVIGRPNCSGGVPIIRGLLVRHKRTPLVILSDPDEPGIDGAERLVLSIPNPSVVLAGPSDIRDYVTRFRRRYDARESIVRVLTGYRQGEWKEISRNLPGQCFNFSSLVRKSA